jgi:hypothetical protein
MAEAYSDMPMDDAGRGLQRIEGDLYISNARIMGDDEAIPEDDIIEWNEYSLRNKALEVGKQAVMSGIGTAALVIRDKIEMGDASEVSDIVAEALHDGIKAAKSEVKAVVAGAIKTAVENKVTDILPEDTSTETICDIAGTAVESAEALYDVATGKSTVVEALDKMGRASVAAVCRMGAKKVKGLIGTIPVIGPVVVTLAGGLLDHMKSSKFADNVYTVVRDAVVATWDGIKQKGKSLLSGLKSLKQAIFG